MPPGAGPQRAVFLPTFTVAGAVLAWLAAGDVGFRDAGELGTAAFELGVAHPTGFAVDLLVLRASALVPLGSLAFRQNAVVALQAALALAALVTLGDLLATKLGVREGGLRRIAVTLPSLALLAWPTFLGTAVASEVYTLSLLLVIVAAYGVLRGGAARGLALCVVGLGVGLHVTAGLYAGLMLALAMASELGADVGIAAGIGRSLGWLRARLPALCACAAVVLYLPLASRRNPALDWGDPETFARVLDHLSAARIRSAYAAEMLAGGPGASLPVLDQLGELWPVLPFALLGVVLGLRAAPAVVLGPLALLATDLAYAAWINPMGAVDRQVGHVAGAALCVLGGLGIATGCAALRARWQRGGYVALAGLAFAWPLWSLPRAELSDDFAASELYGSGGPLSAVPPRSVIVCGSDDACAGGLFAVHVEAVRPDVDVVAAQHLWDPTVLRRLEGLELPAAREPEPSARAAAADAMVRRLAQQGTARPVLFVSDDPLRRARLGRIALPDARSAPYLRVSRAERAGAESLAALDRLRVARFGHAGGPRAERARAGWSLAYDALGTALVASDLPVAVRALRAAASIAPRRAVAWINLGVALEHGGQLVEAARCAQRALQLEPGRATPWVNLARLQLRIAGPESAAQVIALAGQAGVHDARLDALARQLAP
jgi:tetratricopeptide (TPR) repeat protein